MNKKEMNHSRCRELRQIENDIVDTLDRVKNQKRVATLEANRLADELRRKRERYSNLQKAKIAAEVGSAIPGHQSGTVGAIATTLEIQLSILGSEIETLETQLKIADAEKNRLQIELDHFRRQLDGNSRQQRQLDCVRAGF